MKKDYSKDVFKQLQEAMVLIAQLQEELRQAKQRIAELEAMVGKNSGNSSKPPSSDFFVKPINTRKPSSKKSGGQKGHKPYQAELYDEPDEIIEHRVETCECGGEIEQIGLHKVKQLVDIEVVTKVTEHRIFDGKCSCCGKYVRAKCGLHDRVSYGNNLKSLVAMLSFEGNVSLKRTREMIFELTDKIKLSDGTVVKWHNELKRQLAPFLSKVKLEMPTSKVLHKDETGIRINKKIHWLHVLSNKKYTLYHAHQKRGKDADDEMGILEDYGGTLMHDHFKTLYKFGCKHAECNAHILRYLKGVVENQKHNWAQEMIDLLLELHRKKKNGAKIDVERAFAHYEDILKRARPIYYNQLGGEDYNLWKRMGEFKAEHLRFICDVNVPFDNNQAERDLRMIKAKTKISGCFRSDDGAAAFASAKSYTSTMRKNGLNIYSALVSAFNANPICV